LKTGFSKSPESEKKKKGKVATQWVLGGTAKEAKTLDFTPDKGDMTNGEVNLKSEEVSLRNI